MGPKWVKPDTNHSRREIFIDSLQEIACYSWNIFKKKTNQEKENFFSKSDNQKHNVDISRKHNVGSFYKSF